MIATTASDSNPTAPADFSRLQQVPAELLAKLAGDKPSVGALTRLRKLFPEQELFQHAANLPRVRRKLRNKLLLAKTSFADIPRAEMATARPVALYRMHRALKAALARAGVAADAPDAPDGVARLSDLGCGIGGDFLALLELCRAWQADPTYLRAYEQDAFAAWCAQTNAGLLWPEMPCAPADLIHHADVRARVNGAGAPPIPADTVLFLDPTRRAGGHRTINDWSQCEPPDSLWMPWVDGGRPVAVKVAPAFDWRNFRPNTPVQAEALEWRGEVHEISLWWNFAPAPAEPGSSATAELPVEVTREWIAHPLTRTAAAGSMRPGRRATVVLGDPQDAPATVRFESIFLADGHDDAILRTLDLTEEAPAVGDLIGIPASVLLRMDLLPAMAHSLNCPLWAGQPHLLKIPVERETVAARCRLITCGRVVAMIAAREKELRRALNKALKSRRWQPQILGVKNAPETHKLVRQLELQASRKPDRDKKSTAAAGQTPRNAAPGIALLTRFHQSHLVLFLETLPGGPTA